MGQFLATTLTLQHYPTPIIHHIFFLFGHFFGQEGQPDECRGSSPTQSPTRLKAVTRTPASRGPCKLKSIQRDKVISYGEDRNRKRCAGRISGLEVDEKYVEPTDTFIYYRKKVWLSHYFRVSLENCISQVSELISPPALTKVAKDEKHQDNVEKEL